MTMYVSSGFGDEYAGTGKDFMRLIESMGEDLISVSHKYREIDIVISDGMRDLEIKLTQVRLINDK